jgi:hypothetical protein
MKICVTLDNNNIINQFAQCLNDNYTPFTDGIVIDTDLDASTLVENYKLESGQLILLTEQEKEAINSNAGVVSVEPTLIERVKDVEVVLADILGGKN